MPIQKSLGTAGLWISPSTLQAPVGAYILADNIVINSPGVAESRRGFAWFPYELSSVETQFPKASFSFRGTLIVQHRNDLSYNSGAAFVPYTGGGGPPAPQTLRMKAEEMSLNFYFTSDGIRVIDTPIGGTAIPAGEPRGPTPTSVLNPTNVTGAPGTGWLAADAQTAYVATFFRIDANDIDHEGTPSNPVFVTNPADITVPIGGASNLGANVTVAYINHGYTVGTEIEAVFNIADAASFTTGTYTISVASADLFVIPAGTGVPGVTTQPSTYTTNAKNVQVYVELPLNTVAGNTILVYRSKQSVGLNVLPRPQYYLDKEYTLVAGDITAGYFTYTDVVPDDLLQDPLYTNTDDGEPPDSSLQNDNGQPPYCLDLAQFDQRLWGANYRELASLTFSLLGVGSPNGLIVGDTISFGDPGVSFTAIAEASTPNPNTEFRVYTSYDAATNVAKTAQELALTITASNLGMDLFYISGPDDLPGQLLLRSRLPESAGGIPVYVSRPSAWNPVFTTSPFGALTTSTSTSTNGLWFSKQNQPEAVPLLNRIPVGPRNCSILRIRPLRDKLYVFTDIAGTFVVSNSYPYQVTSLSATATLVAPDTLVNFDDAIYGLTTQGVVRFNEAGPTILSVPIESEIKALYGVGLPVLKVQAFAVGYESYRKYILAMPTTVEDSTNTQAWAYDVVTKSWTRWTKAMDSGVIIPQTDLLNVTTPASTKVSYERKNFDRTDYADEDWQVTITAATGGVVSLTSTIEPAAGDLLYQSPILRSLIGSVESTGINTYDVVVNDTIDWTIAAATCYPGIQNILLNTPLFASGPEERKNFREVTYHFRTPGFSLGKGLFAGDTNPYIEQIDFSLGGFGAVGWGLFGWEQPSRPVNKRIAIPTNARRVSYLSVGFALREAQAQWQLMGVSPVYENMSERNTR